MKVIDNHGETKQTVSIKKRNSRSVCGLSCEAKKMMTYDSKISDKYKDP